MSPRRRPPAPAAPAAPAAPVAPVAPVAPAAPAVPAVPARRGAGPRVVSAGASARGIALASGLVARCTRGGLIAARPGEGTTELLVAGRLFARVRPDGGEVVVEVDTRAPGAKAALLVRLGEAHPDRQRARAGWRRVVVRNRTDAARVVGGLAVRSPRERREPPALTVGTVRVRHVLDPVAPGEGHRVLVDATWPPRVARERVTMDAWVPEVAPSRALREAFGPLPVLSRGFRRAYLAELRGGPHAGAVGRLRATARREGLTLLTGVRDLRHAAAVVLAHALSKGRTPRA